jgi:hypothetical protein
MKKRPAGFPAGTFPLCLGVKEKSSRQCELSYVHVDGNFNRTTSFSLSLVWPNQCGLLAS